MRTTPFIQKGMHAGATRVAVQGMGRGVAGVCALSMAFQKCLEARTMGEQDLKRKLMGMWLALGWDQNNRCS